MRLSIRKNATSVKNTAIGRKAQMKNLESAGMIGKQNRPVMNPMKIAMRSVEFFSFL